MSFVLDGLGDLRIEATQHSLRRILEEILRSERTR